LPLKLVLFELSGVLLDEWSEFAALDATMGAVRDRFHLKETAEELSGDFSLRLMDLLAVEPHPIAGVAEEAPSDFQPFEMAAKELFVEMLDDRGFTADSKDSAWFWDTLVREHRAQAKPHGEAPKVLRALQEEGLKLGILTDTDPALVQALLEGADLRGWFDLIVTSRDCGYVKPSPKIFEAGLEAAKVRAEEALMVGPSYERDVQGAVRAGMHGILLDRHDARTVPPEEKATTLRKIMPRVRDLLAAP